MKHLRTLAYREVIARFEDQTLAPVDTSLYF